MSRIRNPVSIVHGYGDVPEITVDGNQIHGVKKLCSQRRSGIIAEGNNYV